MDKRKFKDEDFNIYIASELIAYNVYDAIVRRKKDFEKVDFIAYSYADMYINKDNEFKCFLSAYETLKNEYKVNMLNFKFANDDLKKELYDAIEFGTKNYDIKM